MPARLQQRYRDEIVPMLKKDLGYANVMAVPKVEKVVINMGLGEAVQNPKILDSAVTELTAIAGQKPVVTKARKAISNFKLREGMPIASPCANVSGTPRGASPECQSAHARAQLEVPVALSSSIPKRGAKLRTRYSAPPPPLDRQKACTPTVPNF